MMLNHKGITHIVISVVQFQTHTASYNDTSMQYSTVGITLYLLMFCKNVSCIHQHLEVIESNDFISFCGHNLT